MKEQIGLVILSFIIVGELSIKNIYEFIKLSRENAKSSNDYISISVILVILLSMTILFYPVVSIYLHIFGI